MGRLGFAKDIAISAGLYRPARALHRMLHPTESRRFREHRVLLGHFVKPGDLAFDVGANIGVRTAILLSLGARVVAFEPQPKCAREIAARATSRLTVIQKAVASTETTATLYVKSLAVTASLSPEWYGPNQETLEIETTTLDRAIGQFGVPAFCKIDVEGFELEALRGLSYPIPSLSFEYFCDKAGIARTRECLILLSKFATYSVNLIAGEEARLLVPKWLSMADFQDSFPAIAGGHFYGDIFLTTDPTFSPRSPIGRLADAQE